MRSLKRQLVVGLLLVEGFCALGFAGAALFHEWDLRTRALDAVIQGRSDSLLGAIQDAEDPDDNVAIDPAELVLPREDVYAVYSGNGRLIGSSPDAPSALIARRQDGMESRTIGRHSYRCLQRQGMRIIDRLENGGVGLQRPVTIVYAVPEGHIWHEVYEAASFSVGASVLLLLVTSAMMLFLLRRALKPIEELSVAAGSISLHTLSFDPPPSAMGMSELRPLAGTLSKVIGGLRHSIDQQNRFIADAAHELKTAVSVLHSSIQLLLMHSRTVTEYQAEIEGLLGDSQRVNDLVSRMLATARFAEQRDGSSGGADFSTDLMRVARQSIERLRPIAQAQQVEVRIKNETEVRIRPSADEVEVLVSNLVVNATQHSSPGGLVEVSIDAAEGFALLTVEDHGRGISAEAMPHVFERFYREDASRSRETGGAGLGLSICKAIVDAAEGSIDLESQVGRGTTVRVRLPASESFRLA